MQQQMHGLGGDLDDLCRDGFRSALQQCKPLVAKVYTSEPAPLTRPLHDLCSMSLDQEIHTVDIEMLKVLNILVLYVTPISKHKIIPAIEGMSVITLAHSLSAGIANFAVSAAAMMISSGRSRRERICIVSSKSLGIQVWLFVVFERMLHSRSLEMSCRKKLCSGISQSLVTRCPSSSCWIEPSAWQETRLSSS